MATFEEAVDTVNNKMNKTLSNDELKEIYALYKQATVGDVNIDRPGMLDFKGESGDFTSFFEITITSNF